MRLWSLHPCYLDAWGITALWRESLLALAVVKGETKGYRHHPQLTRFLEQTEPSMAVRGYLWGVYHEACARHFSFNPAKLGDEPGITPIHVTTGQLAFERRHLLKKLAIRAPQLAVWVSQIRRLKTHPLFVSVQGPAAPWEKQAF